MTALPTPAGRPEPLRMRAGALARLCAAASEAYPAPLRGLLLGAGVLVETFQSTGPAVGESRRHIVGTFATVAAPTRASRAGSPSPRPHLVLVMSGPEPDARGGAPARVTAIHLSEPGALVVVPDGGLPLADPHEACP